MTMNIYSLGGEKNIDSLRWTNYTVSTNKGRGSYNWLLLSNSKGYSVMIAKEFNMETVMKVRYQLSK